MLARRLALAIGLIFAFFGSQLPEFTQQYRQRLGGAIDELTTQIAQFDAEAAGQSLDRSQGIARLRANTDTLAQQRGVAVAETVARKDRLERQRAGMAVAGPLSQYAVLAEDFDSGIARRAAADFQPAIPTTSAGLVAAGVAFAIGWLISRLATAPLRGRAKRPVDRAA